MNNSHHNHARTALVLGGASTGNAWEIGVIAGLFDAGLDVTTADLIVGTSAGSTAAAMITSASPPELLAAILATPTRQQPGAGGPAPQRGGAGPVINHMQRTQDIIDSAKDAADMRRRMGAGALELAAASDGSWSEKWRATVASRLPNQEWPERRMLITAVDAETGDPVAFDRDSGITLADAVAASTSSGNAYSIGDRRYIDGGYRRNENSDLAAGFERVLILSPFGGRSRMPAAWGMDLAAQVEELRSGGSRVEAIGPDAESEQLFGVNGMDLSLRPAAARAGHEQGRSLAARLAGFWADSSSRADT